MYNLSNNVLRILDELERADIKNTNPKEETPEQLTEDDFIPIITLDKSYKDTSVKYPAVYIGNVENKKTKLSKYLDNNMQPLEEVKITVPTIIRLSMTKGSQKSKDEEGDITIVSDGVNLISDTGKNITSGINQKTGKRASSVIYEDMNYANNRYFRIKVTPERIQKDAYIDFYANDDDWLNFSVSNTHCGRIAISNTSKIGKQLTKNIESLPKANDSEKLSKDYTYNFPQKSFEVANKYQNPGGMCFAISMTRVAKAFSDIGISNAIKIATSGDDYIYSGTISSNILDKYLGYGVGGALAKNGYAELVTTEEIWSGKLEEGAMLQYWNDPDKKGWTEIKKAIKDTLNGIDNSNFHKGHSVIFKGYIFDDNDDIVALWCYDYSGTQRRFEKDDDEYHRIFLGANLKDKK